MSNVGEIHRGITAYLEERVGINAAHFENAGAPPKIGVAPEDISASGYGGVEHATWRARVLVAPPSEQAVDLLWDIEDRVRSAIADDETLGGNVITTAQVITENFDVFDAGNGLLLLGFEVVIDTHIHRAT